MWRSTRSEGLAAVGPTEAQWAIRVADDAPPIAEAVVTIAVLDSGVMSHPALDAAISDCVDFTHEVPDPGSCSDENGHGTHLAGLLAGQSGEFSGVAPGTRLLIFKICDQVGVCPASALVQALDWAVVEEPT
ncbi:MAG: S8 family serine peptidase [Actinomycetota bacterium]